MEIRKDIQNELLGISEALAKVSSQNVYEIPDEHYFEILSAEIITKINIESNAGLSVPDGYFENFAGAVMNKIKLLEETEDELPELLKNLRHINVYTLPDGYFEKLDNALQNQTGNNAKIVSFHKNISILKYAVAASVIALLGLGIYWFANLNISQQDEALMAIVNNGKKINKNNSFDKELSSLQDDEIVGYLSEKGDDVNAALVASLADEQTLPDEEEYLFDENRLDSYLDEYHIANQKN